MKKALILTVCLFFTLSTSADLFVLRSDRKIEGTLSGITPAIIKIRLKNGGRIETINVHDLTDETAASLPLKNNPYKWIITRGLHEVRKDVSEAFELSKDLKKKYEKSIADRKVLQQESKTLFDLMIKMKEEGRLKEDELKTLSASYKRYNSVYTESLEEKAAPPEEEKPAAPRLIQGVPVSVYIQIKEKAEEKWPGNYEMQKYTIDNQVKAYKSLNP